MLWEFFLFFFLKISVSDSFDFREKYSRRSRQTTNFKCRNFFSFWVAERKIGFNIWLLYLAPLPFEGTTFS